MLQRKICASFLMMLALAATPAVAQQEQHEQHHPGAAPGMGMSPGMPGGAGGMPMMEMTGMMMGREGGIGGMPTMAAMAGHVEGRLAFLKTELKITQGQLPLWNAVADAIRANAKSMSGMSSGGMMGSGQATTLPDKLAVREKIIAAHLDGLRRFAAAVDPLYATFTPEQKKTADELLIGPMGMM